jgi:hypothetical protein
MTSHEDPSSITVEHKGEKYFLVDEETQEVINDDGTITKVIIKYMKTNSKTYDYYKKAHDTYVSKHKDKINERRRAKNSEKYLNDEEYREAVKRKAREYYKLKKNKNAE